MISHTLASVCNSLGTYKATHFFLSLFGKLTLDRLLHSPVIGILQETVSQSQNQYTGLSFETGLS